MLTAIVNHLWQSTLAVGVIAAITTMLRNHGAHVRYWLWWSASAKFLVPFSLLALLGSKLGGARAPLFDAAALPATLNVLAEPMPHTALKWRYAPPSVDGAPAERLGVQTIIRFQLEP